MKKSVAVSVVVAMLGIFAVATAGFAAYEAEKGTLKVKAKTMINGRWERLDDVKVYRLSDKQKISKERKKTGSSGKVSFKNLDDGEKYRIKCKKDGYVNAKNPAKDRYISSSVEIKGGKTVSKSCKLTQLQ